MLNTNKKVKKMTKEQNYMNWWSMPGRPIDTQEQFEALPKHEQNFRWAMFLESNGYQKKLKDGVVKALFKKYYQDKKPLVIKKNGKLK